MQPSDRQAFGELIAGVLAYHRQPATPAILLLWWNGCQRWELEQVTKAINTLTMDPEAGRFPPKIGDVTRVLEGTTTDRAALAWGKTLEAMQRVGAYQDVVFDDPAIHAAVEDLGGWPKLCRTRMDNGDLGFVQHRFCQAHQAYSARPGTAYPRRLTGDRSPDSMYEAKGLPLPQPMFVGEPARCQQVLANGSATGKTLILPAAQAATLLLEAL